MVKVGLINNRHPMPVQNYIFEKEIENVFDFESIKNEIKEFILEKVGVHTVLCCQIFALEFQGLC